MRQKCERCGTLFNNRNKLCPRCGQKAAGAGCLAILLSWLGIGYNKSGKIGCSGCAQPALLSILATAGLIVVLGPVGKLVFPFAPELTLSPDKVPPGGSTHVSGSNFPSGVVTLTFVERTPITPVPQTSLLPLLDKESHLDAFQAGQQFLALAGTTAVNSDGTFNVLVSIPPTWQPGSQHTIEAQEAGQDIHTFFPIQTVITVIAKTSGTSHFQPTLQPKFVDCSQPLGQATLTLDNGGSAQEVSWAISFKPTPWGTASSRNGIVPARHVLTVTITPNYNLCPLGHVIYHLTIQYTLNGGVQSLSDISYTVAGPGWD